jgi:hypothetical protein
VIQDIEGDTVEPTRRRHVVVLSGAVAALSFALLLVLVAPPSREAAVQHAPSPVASPGASSTLTIASNPMNTVYVDLANTSLCPNGSSSSTPSYVVSFDARSGLAYAVQPVPSTSRSAPVPIVADAKTGRPIVWSSAGTSWSQLVTFVYDRQGRYIVTCATPGTTTPPEAFARD